MSSTLHKLKYAWIKGVIFSIIGVLNGMSLLQSTYYSYYQLREDDLEFGISHFGVIMMGILYLTGAVFYTKRIPEKYYPKKFDIWFNSHTIFHIFVFIAEVEFFLVV